MNSFLSAKWENIFLLYINNLTTNEISKIFLTVVHIVIHNVGNNDDIHRSMKCLHSKLQKFSEKYENIKSTYSIRQI